MGLEFRSQELLSHLLEQLPRYPLWILRCQQQVSYDTRSAQHSEAMFRTRVCFRKTAQRLWHNAYLYFCGSWHMTTAATGPELGNSELHCYPSNQREGERFRRWRLKSHKAGPHDRPFLRNKLHSIHVVFSRSIKATHSQRCFCPSCALWNGYESPLNRACSKPPRLIKAPQTD